MRRAALLLAVGTLAGCGGGGGAPEPAADVSPPAATAPAPTPRTPGPGASGGKPATAAETRVIRRWAALVAKGDPAGAAALFSVPALLQIVPGGPTLTARDRSVLRGFNASLPCAAKLVRATRRGPYADALFTLGPRPGQPPTSCRGTARTAFRIRAGRIHEWRRLPDTGSPPVTPPAGDDSAV